MTTRERGAPSSTGSGREHGQRRSAAAWYEIRVAGELDPSWRPWFEGMQLHVNPAGETTLSGCVVDQSALHGLLSRIRDLNLTLISVRRVPDGPTKGVE